MISVVKKLSVIAFCVATAFLLQAQIIYAKNPDVPDMTNPLINKNYDLSTVYKIGIMRPALGTDVDAAVPNINDEIDHVFAQFKEALSKTSKYKIVEIPSESFTNVDQNRIVELGNQYEVDAMMMITLRSFRRKYNKYSTNHDCIKALVSIGMQVYETKTGTLLIDYIQDRKGRNCNLMKQAANVAYDTPYIFGELGLTGRNADDTPPSIILTNEFSNDIIKHKTSVPVIEAKITDDTELSSYKCFSDGEEVYSRNINKKEQTLNCYFDGAKKEAKIIVYDWNGNESSNKFEVVSDGEVVTGKIVHIIDEDVYLNIGAQAGVREGMAFNVVGYIEIVDPDSNELLDTVEKQFGTIVVRTVKERTSIANLVISKKGITLEDLKPGFKVF